MEIRYSITLHPTVISHDLPHLDPFWRHTIRDAIRAKLRSNPEVYGKPLRHALNGCRTLRIGDYRVVFQIIKQRVHIVAVIHRRTEYKDIEKRI
jgi:mRNA interferase RelE/StbE